MLKRLVEGSNSLRPATFKRRYPKNAQAFDRGFQCCRKLGRPVMNLLLLVTLLVLTTAVDPTQALRKYLLSGGVSDGYLSVLPS